jgi:predicted Zn-dependent peptidase
MKPYILCALVCAVFIFAWTANVSAEGIHLPPHQRVVLKNGLTVLLLEKHEAPFVSISAIVKIGSSADPTGQEGLAAATAGLLRRGTRHQSAEQFASDLDFIGASFDGSAEPDLTTVSAEFLVQDLDRGLSLFADAVTSPSFSQQEVSKYLAQSLDQAKGSKDDAQSVLGTYFDGYLFAGHLYGRPVSGDELSLQSITALTIADFYNKYYAPGNTILAVAGDFKASDMLARLEALFGSWPTKPVPVVSIPSPNAVKESRLLLVDKPDSTQTFFAIGNVGTTATDPDRVAIKLVNTIFGGAFSSMLNQALRVDSGLTYGAGSHFDLRKAPGSFIMSSYTQNDTTVRAIDLALETLRRLHRDSVTQEQLDSARRYIKGQYPPSIETSSQLASLIARNEFYGLDDNEVNQLEAQLDAVTPEMARRVIEKDFPSDSLVFVLIGKASEIGSQVKKYAEHQDSRKISDPGFWAPQRSNSAPPTKK